jgi:membrane-associated phospholipid phosphatase
MANILDWGIDVVLWFQQFSPTLDLPFSFFTFLGEELFLLLLLPLIYWSLDRALGVRLTALFILSLYLNNAAKVLGNQPRPFEYDTRVRMLFATEGRGFPSGHTQSAVVIWGYLATQLKRRWATALAALLMGLIPLSRIYLGLHFPTDLLGGYVLGAIVLLLYLWLQPTVEARLAEMRFAALLSIALLLPFALLLLYPGVDKGVITMAGTALGMGVGFLLERRWLRFVVNGTWWKRALRFILGAIGLLALWGGLRALFAGLEPFYLLRFIRYLFVGLWVTWGAPWLFVKFGLAERAPENR